MLISIYYCWGQLGDMIGRKMILLIHISFLMTNIWFWKSACFCSFIESNQIQKFDKIHQIPTWNCKMARNVSWLWNFVFLFLWWGAVHPVAKHSNIFEETRSKTNDVRQIVWLRYVNAKQSPEAVANVVVSFSPLCPFVQSGFYLLRLIKTTSVLIHMWTFIQKKEKLEKDTLYTHT